MLFFVPTSAEAQTTIGTFEGSVPIETADGEGTAINRIVVEAQEAGSVTIHFDDVVLSEGGGWERVEFGTTPYSLSSLIVPEPSSLRYEGEAVGSRQNFEVVLRVRGSDGQPRAGFVTYTFVPDSALEPAPGIRQGVAARVRLGEWPASLDGIPAAVEITELRLARSHDEITGFVDRLIPDLPRVINRGPAVIRARTTNVGDVLVQSETTLKLARLPWIAAVPFVRPEGFTVITYIDRPRLLLPTESAVSSVATTASLVEGDEIDRLPFFGLVRITAEASGYLGASRDEMQVSRMYLVAPWKEAALLLAAYWAFRLLKRRNAGRDAAAGRAVESVDAVREPEPPRGDTPAGLTTLVGASVRPRRAEETLGANANGSGESDARAAGESDRENAPGASRSAAPSPAPRSTSFDDLQSRLDEMRARFSDRGPGASAPEPRQPPSLP